MALFKKKLSLEEIIEGIKSLSEEEQAKLKQEMTGGATEETTEETNVEETAVEEVETNDNEVAEEVEETTENVEEVTEEATEPVEEVEESTEQEEVSNEPNETEGENKNEIIEQLTNRVADLEAKLGEFEELKEQMLAYTKKQAEQFGYEGKIPGAKKDYKDMSASELSNELKSEI